MQFSNKKYNTYIVRHPQGVVVKVEDNVRRLAISIRGQLLNPNLFFCLCISDNNMAHNAKRILIYGNQVLILQNALKLWPNAAQIIGHEQRC